MARTVPFAITKHKISPRSLPGLEALTELVLEDDVSGWLAGFYTQLRALVTKTPLKGQDPDFLQGLLHGMPECGSRLFINL